MEEIWKDVIGYEGLYQVSNLGNVRSIYCRGRKRILNLCICKSSTGYSIVSVHKNKKQKHLNVHREIAKCFCENPQNKPDVNHKNGIKTDNRVENLEWVTRSENNQHAYDVLGKVGTFKGKYGHDHPNSIPVMQFDINGEFIKEYPNSRIAAMEYGIQQTGIRFVCNKNGKTSGGFTWKYKKDCL